MLTVATAQPRRLHASHRGVDRPPSGGIALVDVDRAGLQLARLRTGYNLPISNVPGPQTEMSWNGAHIEEIYPVSTVYDGMGLNVTVSSYADRMTFGYVAGREILPDIATLIPLTERALDELETAVAVAP